VFGLSNHIITSSGKTDTALIKKLSLYSLYNALMGLEMKI